MEPFAIAQDLADRWRVLDDAEAGRADVLLADASLWLRQWFPDLDARIAAGTLDSGIPLSVACAMVKRAMIASGKEGVTYAQDSEIYGPFSHQTGTTYKNPEGNLYVTALERDLLEGSTSDAISMECAGW